MSFNITAQAIGHSESRATSSTLLCPASVIQPIILLLHLKSSSFASCTKSLKHTFLSCSSRAVEAHCRWVLEHCQWPWLLPTAHQDMTSISVTNMVCTMWLQKTIQTLSTFTSFTMATTLQRPDLAAFLKKSSVPYVKWSDKSEIIYKDLFLSKGLQSPGWDLYYFSQGIN